MGNAVDAIMAAKPTDPVIFTVGHHTDGNLPLRRVHQPLLHQRLRNIGGIGHDGVVKIQHQQFDAKLLKELRSQVRQFIGDYLGK